MQPFSQHSSDHEALVALLALGVLGEGAQRSFTPHLLGCNRCQAIFAQDRQTVAWLSALTPEVEPSVGFEQRLLQRAAEAVRRGRLES